MEEKKKVVEEKFIFCYEKNVGSEVVGMMRLLRSCVFCGRDDKGRMVKARKLQAVARLLLLLLLLLVYLSYILFG